MKWLKFLKVAKKRALEGGAETGATDDAGSPHKHTKRRSMQHERKERTSIEQWHEARKSRTSIDICAAFNVTTTERLSVCKAGITILINRTYIVIKHLGSGSSGQVKLAFNLRSKKLVAIKAVRKGGGAAGQLLGSRDARSYDGRGSPGGQAGLSTSQSVNTVAGGGGCRDWRSITPSSLLSRSTSSGVGATSTCHGSSPSPHRRLVGQGPGAPPGRYQTEDFVREIAILKRLSHPNIVQLVEVIDDPSSDCLLLVMGYVEGSTLQLQQLEPGRWRSIPEESAWRYARDVLCGLEYLHCHGVVHGDLKPANFIEDSLTGVVRILDFGSAVLHGRVMGEDALRGAHVPMSCTPGFRSPESLVAGYRPSFELDMWALGVCLYLWMFGELPFKGSAPFIVYENIRSSPLVIPTSTRISTQLTDLIARLLDKAPQSRMTVHEAVQHPWTTAQGLAPLRTTSPLVMATRMQLAAEQLHTTNPLQQQQDPEQRLTSHPLPQPFSAPAVQQQQLFKSPDLASLLGVSGAQATQQQQRQWWQQATQPYGHALGSQSSSSANMATVAVDTTSDVSDPARRGWPPFVREVSGGEPRAVTAVPSPPVRSAALPSPPFESAAARQAAPLTAAATSSSLYTVAQQQQQPGGASPEPEGPWRMSAVRPNTSSTGMSNQMPCLGRGMPRITEGSTGNTGSHGGLVTAAMAAVTAGGSASSGRRNSCEAWELRRSVTDEELQAAISRCCDPTGTAAVLMEGIFSEVTFAAKHQIICAGDPLDRIYLITAGEVEIYHDLVQDGPDAPCPHKPIIEGLSDPESELDDPGDFLNIRLPGGPVQQLERLSTGLLNITGGGGGGDRSIHGASLAMSAMGGPTTAAGASGGPSGPSTATGFMPPQPSQPSVFGMVAPASNSGRATLTGVGGFGAGGTGREHSSSSNGLFSRTVTQTGHLIVAAKGPGDSLGFAGMLPSSASGGGAASSLSCGEPGSRQPVWSANVRARTQVTAFVASIESLHKLARAHPQVEPLLQQMAVQQETDLAVAEAMRSLRLVGSAGRGGGSGAAGGSNAQQTPGSRTAAGSAGDSGLPSGRHDALAAAAGRAGGASTGISSETESESCGTAGTTITDLTTAASSLGSNLQSPLAASLAVWHQGSSGAMAVGGLRKMVESRSEAAMDVMMA